MAKFKKGQSGNPAGRTPGIPSPTAKLRKAIADDMPAILNVLRTAALGGDVQAASLLLSRCLPPLRPESPAVEIPMSGGTLGERCEAVVEAVLSGGMSPSSAGELMGALAQQARILEVSELERRIAALEGKER